VVAEVVERRLSQVGWGANAAGVLVVAASIVFLAPVFVESADILDLALWNVPIAVVYFVASGLLIDAFFTRRAEALEWVAEGREPNPREHKIALGLAVDEVKASALGWMGAGILFTTLNGFLHSWSFAAVVGATTWLGGETTCAIVYLLSERALRPLTAQALAARPMEAPDAPGVRDRLMFAWALGTGVPLVGVLVVGAVGLTKSGVDKEYLSAAVLFLGVVASAIGLFATVFAAKAIADPLTNLRRALERLAKGDLDVAVDVNDGSEVGLLQAGFNHMAEGLREREQIRDLFGRQVGHDVARAALRDGVRLGGEEREVGVFFVDLVGSSSMALSMPPTEVVRVLNLFFRAVVETVEAHGGLVNKFEGDGALCVFGAPVPCEDPAGQAMATARALAERLSRDVPQVDFGIGVSAGVAVAGNVGAEKRFEYTVIGDPVNEAARLAELAKQHPERVLASERALGQADTEGGEWRLAEKVVLRGRSGETGVAHPRS
jgi:adenylate cyclase